MNRPNAPPTTRLIVTKGQRSNVAYGETKDSDYEVLCREGARINHGPPPKRELD